MMKDFSSDEKRFGTVWPFSVWVPLIIFAGSRIIFIRGKNFHHKSDSLPTCNAGLFTWGRFRIPPLYRPD